MTDELKKLVDSYRPSPQTLEAMAEVRLLATVGPSASGKTTIMKALAAADPQFKLVVGETTRPLRRGEKEGEDFITRSQNEVIDDLKAGLLTQVVIGPSGDYLHCTHVSNFPTDGIGLFPLIPQGVRQFRALGLKSFAAAFIVPADFRAWRSRLDRQAEISGWSTEQFAGRLAEAKKSYEFALNDKEMSFILNDDIEKAAGRLRQVGHGQEPDDEAKARQICEDNYHKLTSYVGAKS